MSVHSAPVSARNPSDRGGGLGAAARRLFELDDTGVDASVAKESSGAQGGGMPPAGE